MLLYQLAKLQFQYYAVRAEQRLMIRAPTFGFQVASLAPLSCELFPPSLPITSRAIQQLRRLMTTLNHRFLHATLKSMPQSMQASLSILVARSKKPLFPALMQAFLIQAR